MDAYCRYTLYTLYKNKVSITALASIYIVANMCSRYLDFREIKKKKTLLSLFLNVCVCVHQTFAKYKLSNKWDPIWYYLFLIKNSYSLPKAYGAYARARKRESECMSKGDWKWSWTWTFLNIYRPKCNECANSTIRTNHRIWTRISAWKGWQMHKNRRKWYVTEKIINLLGYVIVDLLFKTFTFHVHVLLTPQPSLLLLLLLRRLLLLLCRKI